MFSCKSDDLDINHSKEIAEANEIAWQYMQEWYLWNEGMPDIDPQHMTSPHRVVRELAWFEYDRWSSVGELASYNSFYDEGTYVGFGYGLDEDLEDKLRVVFVYEDSPFAEAGIKRGYEIIAINGVPYSQIDNLNTAIGPRSEGASCSFTVLDYDGNEQVHDLVQRVCTIDPILHYEVKEVNGIKVGHFVFKAFIEPAVDAFDEVFAFFEAEGIDELVVDLRYNRGGRVNVAVDLCERIAPASAVGQPLIKYRHNADKAENDRTTLLGEKINELGLSRLIALTSYNSASASELVINCLRPYMDVIMIGNKTYGKPVGSYGFTYENYVISPIAFAVNNANDEGGYFTSIKPESWTAENYSVPFGDDEEGGFQQALYYIQNGSFSDEIGKTNATSKLPVEDWDVRELDWEIGSW